MKDNIKNQEIANKKFNSNESLITNLSFISFYTLSVFPTINFHTFFLINLQTNILFIVSIFFCCILLLQTIIMFLINRQINITESVFQNIKKINVIYLCVFIVRCLFLLFLIPIQLILFYEFFKNFLLIPIPLYVIISISFLSITFGITYFIKKRLFILNLITEIKER
jgi:hypothetical protein